MEQNTRDLLAFIIKQKKELKDYMQLVPLLQARFTITKPGCGKTDHTQILVQRIISWENGNQTTSLEETLNDLFFIKFTEQ